jgi:hypothetical protein
MPITTSQKLGAMRGAAPRTRSTVRTVPILAATLLGALLMLHAAPAGAAPSGPVITVSGFADQPASRGSSLRRLRRAG